MSAARTIGSIAACAWAMVLAACTTRFVAMVPPDEVGPEARRVAVLRLTQLAGLSDAPLSTELAILEISGRPGSPSVARAISSADAGGWEKDTNSGNPTFVHFRDAAEPRSAEDVIRSTCRSRRGALGQNEAGAFWIVCYRGDHETRARPWYELGQMDHEVVIFRRSYDQPECRLTIRGILESAGIRPAPRDHRPGRTDVNDKFRIVLSPRPGRLHVVRSYPGDFDWPDFPTSLVVTADDCGARVSRRHLAVEPRDQIFALSEHGGGYWAVAGRTGMGNRLSVIAPDGKSFPVAAPVAWHGLRVELLPERQALLHHEAQGDRLVEVEQNFVTGATSRTRFDLGQVFGSREPVPALED